MAPSSFVFAGRWLVALLFVAFATGGFGIEVSAQEQLDDILGTLGTAERIESDTAEAAAPGEGSVGGQVFNRETGSPVAGVTVVIEWPDPGDGSAARQEVTNTDVDGAFEFPSVPAGRYRVSFIKAGYRASAMTDFEVLAARLNRADFPLPPVPSDALEQVMELEAFVVEASTVGELMEAIELRLESDQLLNILSAEDLSRFAASDVADALKRVAGVNIVEGQFAIIRGLEDRYSSTLYNGAAVPSPDPDKQSVQLDLFPSDIVSNLVVSKSFSPELPSNSSGGSIDIVTGEYPEFDEGEHFQLKLSGGAGFNENAVGSFRRLTNNSPTGPESDRDEVIESDMGGSIAGRGEILARELRFKGVFNREIDFETAEGFQESREPALTQFFRGRSDEPIIRSGDLSLGELSLSAGRFDLSQSERAEQWTGFASVGFDLDREGNHRIDASGFFTRKREEVIQQKDNGVLPNFDYGVLADLQAQGDEILPQEFNNFATLGSWISRSIRNNPNDAPSRGPLWYTSFFEGESFERERDLRVFQLNGSHDFARLPGLRVHWAANQARTTQDESAFGARFFFEPNDVSRVPATLPASPSSFGAGAYAANGDLFLSDNDIEENQDFGRVDLEYETGNLFDGVTLEVRAGGWFERSKRSVSSGFLESPSVRGLSQFAILAGDPLALGGAILGSLDSPQGGVSGRRSTTNEGEREIWAWSLGVKLSFREKLDVLAGLRREKIRIEAINDALIGEVRFGAPEIFPSRYLFFDRLDNPDRGEVFPAPPAGTVFNDEVLGIDVPADPATGYVDLTTTEEVTSLINGEIDETETLPSFGIAFRPIEGLTFRGAYSKTVARPSFREMGFYVSVEPGNDDLIVGNPQLQLSKVESFDSRVEYTWGDAGDLFALSGFVKNIDDPIESIVVRNPLNLEFDSSALFRTFFNNPSRASLWGIEAEARKNLGFLGPSFFDHISVGSNFTYIDAEVERSEAELARAAPFFGVADSDVSQFSGLERKRRLFGQPEWIVNADIAFDHPGWGTKATLAFFAISDVLDAAGSANLGPDGRVLSFTIDRYIDSFHQLDFVLSQEIWRGLVFRSSIKNLTDSKRRILYDPNQTNGDVAERSLRVGRDYSFSLSYELRF